MPATAKNDTVRVTNRTATPLDFGEIDGTLVRLGPDREKDPASMCQWDSEIRINRKTLMALRKGDTPQSKFWLDLRNAGQIVENLD